MRRRAFLRAAARLSGSAAGFALLSGCDVRPSAETRPVVRIGVLQSGSAALDPRLFDALRGCMRELGWIEGPTAFELVINLKAAQALGLAIPPSVAAQVTDWIR